MAFKRSGLTSSGLENAAGEMSSYKWLLYNRLVKKEKLEMFIWFANFVLAIVENVSLLVVLRDGTNVTRTKKAPLLPQIQF